MKCDPRFVRNTRASIALLIITAVAGVFEPGSLAMDSVSDLSVEHVRVCDVDQVCPRVMNPLDISGVIRNSFIMGSWVKRWTFIEQNWLNRLQMVWI